MSYVVLARKWRPQSFDDLAGQGHVSTTLENAIAKGRVAHAFLFTGVRGVGKTTSARILAKALNCVKGPTAHPCQVCPQCMEITAGSDLDVQEIDGASYNGVDEVRRLQESLPYRPARDRFKIFIVDEVHMLSNAAWNAFLKTLEEPPPHVKFIFATTEVHKVPVTILSRCQRYDFKLIGAQVIAARLRFVLEQEGVKFEEGAVQIVAREAAGSMRDAMSLLDQVLASVGGTSGDALSAEGVAKVLGVAARSVLHDLARALLAGDAGACLTVIGDLAREGYDLPHVARDFLSQLRDLMVAKVAPDPGKLLDLTDVELADVKAVAEGADVDDLARVHQGFSRSFDDITKGGQPRQALEMTLVRLARRPPLLPVEELLSRLADLERRLGGGGGAGPSGGADRGRGGPPPARRPGPPGPGAAPASPERPATAVGAPSVPRTAPATVAAPVPEVRTAPPPVAAHVPEARTAPPPVAAHVPEARTAPPPVAAHVPEVRTAPPPVAAHVPEAQTAAPAEPAPVPPPREAPKMGNFAKPMTFTAPTPRAPEAPRSPSTPPPSGQPPVSDRTPTLAVTPEMMGKWRDVLARVRRRRAPLASVLEHAAVLVVGPTRIELGYERGSFLVGQATDAASKELLAAEASEHFGGKVEIAFETVERGHGAMTVAQLEGAERKLRVDAARRAVEDHPLVTTAIRVLGAELKDVRLPESAAEA